MLAILQIVVLQTKMCFAVYVFSFHWILFVSLPSLQLKRWMWIQWQRSCYCRNFQYLFAHGIGNIAKCMEKCRVTHLHRWNKQDTLSIHNALSINGIILYQWEDWWLSSSHWRYSQLSWHWLRELHHSRSWRRCCFGSKLNVVYHCLLVLFCQFLLRVIRLM